MPLNVSEVVNVQLNDVAMGLQTGDFGKLAFLTQDAGGSGASTTAAFPDTTKPGYVECSSMADVKQYWGSGSPLFEAASVFFAQSPRPKSMVVGYWDSSLPPADVVNKFNDVYPGWYVARPLPPTGWFASDQDLQDWVKAVALYPKKRMSMTTLKAAHLEDADTNIIKTIATLGLNNLFLQYDKRNNQYADISAMARALSVNFSGNRTTITLKFKQEPGVAGNDQLTTTEAAKCRKLGINFYTYYDTFLMLAEGTVVGYGTPRFWDELHGLDWFCNAVQVYVFNALAQSPTKVPQTNKGMEKLVGAATVPCQMAVDNGFAAPGIWYGDEFGTLRYGDRLETGFYIYIPDVDDQPQTDREARKAVVMQIALKLAGAVHSADVLINFTR